MDSNWILHNQTPPIFIILEQKIDEGSRHERKEIMLKFIENMILQLVLMISYQKKIKIKSQLSI